MQSRATTMRQLWDKQDTGRHGFLDYKQFDDVDVISAARILWRVSDHLPTTERSRFNGHHHNMNRKCFDQEICFYLLRVRFLLTLRPLLEALDKVVSSMFMQLCWKFTQEPQVAATKAFSEQPMHA
eukprot:scaffold68524_cov39-Prasinocladus_malaysianus.AAC.1